METQEELGRRMTDAHRMSFDFMYPIWKCPDCGRLNRSLYTFGEMCSHCGADHTTDWENHLADSVVKQRFEDDAQLVEWEAQETATLIEGGLMTPDGEWIAA